MSAAAWQRLSKPRRAAVYRSIGRAARAAREDRKPELVSDLRTALDLLRSLARPAPRRAPRPKRS